MHTERGGGGERLVEAPTHLVSFVNPLIGTAIQDVGDPCIPEGQVQDHLGPEQGRGRQLHDERRRGGPTQRLDTQLTGMPSQAELSGVVRLDPSSDHTYKGRM